LIHALVEAQAEQRPNAVAVVCESERITYADLNARANQIAHRLRAQGVGPEVMAGLYMERSIRTIVAIVGILKAGGCYVPIDLSYPQDRVAYILENSGAKVMITDAERVGAIPEFKGTVLGLDADYEEVGSEATGNLNHIVEGSNAAYVIILLGPQGGLRG